jgi:hypothetical protein
MNQIKIKCCDWGAVKDSADASDNNKIHLMRT